MNQQESVKNFVDDERASGKRSQATKDNKGTLVEG